MAMPMPTMSMKTATSTNQMLPRAGDKARAGPGVSFMGGDPLAGEAEFCAPLRPFLAARVYVGGPTLLAQPRRAVRAPSRALPHRLRKDLHRGRAHLSDWAP